MLKEFLNSKNFKLLVEALRYQPFPVVLTNIYLKILKCIHTYSVDLVSGDSPIGTLTVEGDSIRFKDAWLIKARVDLVDDSSFQYDIELEEEIVASGQIEKEKNELSVLLSSSSSNGRCRMKFEGIDQACDLNVRKVNELTTVGVLDRCRISRLIDPNAYHDVLDENFQIHSKFSASITPSKRCDLRDEIVTIIIPTKDEVGLLRICVESIIKHTIQPFRIIVINNNSEQQITFDYFDSISKNENVTVWDYSHPFNYSAMHNAVMAKVDTEFICFLNNDIEIKTDCWLRRMMSDFMYSNTGAVGCRLIYPNGSIQHDGIYFNLCPSAPYVDHINLKMRTTDPLFYHMKERANVVGVTGACMLTRKSYFHSLGGFEEHDFPIAFNDVDFCLKLLKDGKKVIVHTDIYHIHHESLTRRKGSGHKGERRSFKLLLKKWRSFIERLTEYPKHDLPVEMLESWRSNR